MTVPRILVVIGTPLAGSLNHALAHAYAEAARTSGSDVRVLDLASDTVPGHPAVRNELRFPRTNDDLPLSADVAGFVSELEWANHLAIFFPMWWGSYPAALKAWIDRVFLSGSAFRYRARGKLWDKLLTGRTARIVMTMDSPKFWNALLYRDAAIRSLKTATLGYCGIRVRGVTRLSEVRHRGIADYERWVLGMASFGATDVEYIARRESRTSTARTR